MNNKLVFKSIITLLLLLIFLSGCSISSPREKQDDIVAYISANKEGEYEKAYKQMGLGVLFDFNLKLLDADQSDVKIWIEGYQDGKKMGSSELLSLSYGPDSKPVETGHVGFGLVYPGNENSSLFLYSNGSSAHLENYKLNIGNLSTWEYAIGSEKIGLRSGETRILAGYRRTEAEDDLQTFDYQDEASVEKMIQEDKLVLLLKIKVEEVGE